MRPMILIFYAFAREIAPFKRTLETRSALRIAGLSGVSGSLGGRDLTMVATGIGTARARQTARLVLREFPRPELVISTGVAGGLSHGLRPGDLVLADRLIVGHPETHQATETHHTDGATGDWAQAALRAASIEFAAGALLTAARVLHGTELKRAAKNATGAIAVDMESAALAIETAAHGHRFVCVRAIVDSLTEEFPGAELADEHGHMKPGAVASLMIRNPGAILQIPRMMRNLGSATRAMSAALTVLCAAAPRGEP